MDSHKHFSLSYIWRRISLYIIHVLFIFNWSNSQSSHDTDLPPYRSHFFHQGPAIGGPTTSAYTNRLLSVFSRQNSINNSYPKLGTIPPHLCNHISYLSFPSGWSIYHVSGIAGHSATFSGRLPSAYGINTPLVAATLASSLSFSETIHKFPERLLSAIDFIFCLVTLGIFFLCGITTYLCLPTKWTGTCTLVYLASDISIALNIQTLPVSLTQNLQGLIVTCCSG